MKKLAQGFNTAAQDSNPGSRSRESEALPLSHCALGDVIDKGLRGGLNLFPVLPFAISVHVSFTQLFFTFLICLMSV